MLIPVLNQGDKCVATIRKGKKWTDEEKQYLADNWGSVSLRTIAKNLGRSENSVTVMKVRMGLGCCSAN